MSASRSYRVMTIGDVLTCYRRQLDAGCSPVEAAERVATILPTTVAGVMETVGSHHLTAMQCERDARTRQEFTLAWLRLHPGWRSYQTVATAMGGPNRQYALMFAKDALRALADKGLVECNGRASYRITSRPRTEVLHER